MNYAAFTEHMDALTHRFGHYITALQTDAQRQNDRKSTLWTHSKTDQWTDSPLALVSAVMFLLFLYPVRFLFFLPELKPTVYLQQCAVCDWLLLGQLTGPRPRSRSHRSRMFFFSCSPQWSRWGVETQHVR